MTDAHRDLAAPEPWTRSLERSRRRRALMPKARRESRRKKHVSAALATAVVAGPATPLAAAQVTSGDLSAAVAAESPANRAIEIREGGLPLQVGSQGDLVLQVQRALHVDEDGIFGVQTDAAVRSYQQTKGLDVDGIVGLATWGALFPGQTHGAASGAAIGGSNIPAAAQGKVEQTLQVAGNQLAAQVETGYSGTGMGTGTGTGTGTTGTGTPGTTPGATTPVANPAPGTTTVSGCGSSTIVRPVSGPVTSPYGPRGGRNHDGMDIGAPTGTPVRAAACGTVSLAGQQSGYGNIVCITHTSQFSTCYAHLSRFGTSQGARVQQGQVIGYVGCTGNCTGPHLHFETRVGGVARDPSSYLGGASMPGASATQASATSAKSTSGTTTASSSSQTQYGIGGGTSSTSQENATMTTADGQPTGANPEEQPSGTTEQPAGTSAEQPGEPSASEIAAEVTPAELTTTEPTPAEPATTAPAEPTPAETAPAPAVPAPTVEAETPAVPAASVAAETPAAPAEATPVETAPAPAVPA
ncbi:MAG TPA: peptidoglycan DD-metalloendopeptidase family protein, partial [Thermoleophilaceae bacterium]|nr:peptidoglycan DD-metalloendopeptidase family protein [Thermoleophilaceae bacterium]